jgi:hypothetical protein
MLKITVAASDLAEALRLATLGLDDVRVRKAASLPRSDNAPRDDEGRRVRLRRTSGS